jgi:HEAT repeat protein
MERHKLEEQEMRVPNRSIIIWTLLAVMVLVCFLAFRTIQQQLSSAKHQDDARQIEIDAQRRQIASIIAKLQSRDQSVVFRAQAELAEVGEGAITPLISILTDVTNQAAKRPESVPSGSAPEPLERVDFDPDAKSRVENAVYETLGRLHATRAVPLLIAIIEEDETNDMIQGMSPPMRALAQIGTVAVPQLIESIDRAKTTALGSAELQGSNLTEEERRRNLSWIEGGIELRALLVLREIGDQRAIPVLERLQATSDNQFIVRQAREAIEKIQTTSPQ